MNRPKNMKFHNQFIRPVIIIISFLFITNVHAVMYKWVDEEGNTHYSQTPPNTDVEVETIKPPPKVDTEAASKVLEEQNKKATDLRDKRLAEAEEQKKVEQEKDEKEKQCQQAKARLASYQRPRVNQENSDGTIRTLSEEERQAEIKKSKDYIDKVCN